VAYLEEPYLEEPCLGEPYLEVQRLRGLDRTKAEWGEAFGILKAAATVRAYRKLEAQKPYSTAFAAAVRAVRGSIAVTTSFVAAGRWVAASFYYASAGPYLTS